MIILDIHVLIDLQIIQVEIITIPVMGMVLILVDILMYKFVELIYMNHQMVHVVLVQQVSIHQIITILVVHVLILLQITQVEIITIPVMGMVPILVDILIQINVGQMYMNHQMEHVALYE
jgi:hypothetical protein